MDRDSAKRLTTEIAQIGRDNTEAVSPTLPDVSEISPSNPEVLTRYLYLMAVLDQGPDPKGVRMLLNNVVERLYSEGIPILTEPDLFFEHLQRVSTLIEEEHSVVKQARAAEWAESNESSPEDYALYFSQSRFGMQTTDYIGFYLMSRWGTPFYYITRLSNEGRTLREFIEEFDSCEIMTDKLKSHSKYGLGKAIGPKAAHLFAKWYVHTFDLRTQSARDRPGWGQYSYEVPFDSNAGRVLFRTGWLLAWADLDEYRNWNAIQTEAGRGDNHYIRVTNIRGSGATKHVEDPEFRSAYDQLLTQLLRTKTSQWRKVEIQQIPNVLLLDSEYTLGEFDDGLMSIGTSTCLNRDNPLCSQCPLQEQCVGHQERPELIQSYNT
jgi:hypothetical protein